MSSNHILQKIREINLRIYIILVCLALLVSCTYSNPIAQESPIITSEPITQTSLPNTSQETPDRGTPESISIETPIATSTSQVTPEENTSTPIQINNARTRYDLDAILDYYQHSLSVTETISYMNNNLEEVPDLTLVVEPNRRQGAFRLESLTWEAGESIEAYDLNGDQLYIPLEQPLAPGDELRIILRYILELPEILPPSDTNRPLPYGYTERQTNIVDWYPYIPPYRPGEGWLVHQNWWFGEHQVFDIAEFQVRLTLTEPVKDLVIAASAPAEQDGDTYIYHLETARSFALSVSNEFIVQTTSVGDVTIYSYSFPFDKIAGVEALHNTADALQLFSELIMPYPHSSLSVVEADFLDSMEYDGLYFLSHGFYNLYEGSPKGYLTFIAAHETAHQWWYGLVGNDQAMEPWLDEAICTYMENVFYENIYANYPSGSEQSLVDWWWIHRVNFYDPDGWIDGTIYDFDQFRPYRDAVYLNGAKFLDDLRNLIGDQAFFTFLRDYANQNRYQIATATEFFDILRENSSKNLDSLISEYFQTAK